MRCPATVLLTSQCLGSDPVTQADLGDYAQRAPLCYRARYIYLEASGNTAIINTHSLLLSGQAFWLLAVNVHYAVYKKDEGCPSSAEQ